MYLGNKFFKTIFIRIEILYFLVKNPEILNTCFSCLGNYAKINIQ